MSFIPLYVCHYNTTNSTNDFSKPNVAYNCFFDSIYFNETGQPDIRKKQLKAFVRLSRKYTLLKFQSILTAIIIYTPFFNIVIINSFIG